MKKNIEKENNTRKISSILIAVTYRCNGNCSYCYARKYEKIFSQDMSLINFIKIVNLHKKNGGNSVGIIGGEPTLWKNIDEAILFCRLRNIKTTVFTNGFEKLKIAPDKVYLNVSGYFGNRKNQFLKTLDFYQKNNFNVNFRYNHRFGRKNDFNEILKLAEKFKKAVREIHLVPMVPYEIKRELGKEIFKMAQSSFNLGFRTKIANPVPPCIFSSEELKFLKQNCGYYSKCNLGGLPLINPDGKTVQLCSKLFIFKNLDKFDGKFPQNAKKIFEKELEIFNSSSCLPFSKCLECEFFLKKKCLGGCVAFR